MRTTAFCALLLLLSASAFAQDDQTQAPKPDFSRPTLVRVLSTNIEAPQHPSAIQFDVGSVTFNALGTRWRFVYLPILMPFSGSFTRGRGIGSDVPNAFELTGTEIPYTPRTWRENREMSKEMKRIEQTERAKIKVNPE